MLFFFIYGLIRIDTLESQAIVRINGVLPDISILGDVEKSERAAEVKRTGIYFGSYLAQQLTIMYPNKVNSLVLIG